MQRLDGTVINILDLVAITLNVSFRIGNLSIIIQSKRRMPTDDFTIRSEDEWGVWR